MKKMFLLFTFILAATFAWTQKVDRELVVVEIGTGTWCPYCPGAAMGADDLVENGHDVAIIEHHGGDSYEIPSSTGRLNYYGITGYPTAWFDGQNPYVGGSSSNSLYSTYLSKVNYALSQPSSFTIDLSFTSTGNNYDATMVIDKVDNYSGTNLVAHLALTESHIDESWQGMSELNFVNRGMFPNYNGTALDFSSGDQQTVNISFSLDDEYVRENCELVAFIQDADTKAVLQGTKASLNVPIGNNNVSLLSIDSPEEADFCGSEINPIISVENMGSETLTSFDIEYQVNDESVQSYSWTGSLEYSDGETIELPALPVNTIQETNILSITLQNPNGTTDDNQDDNSLTSEFYKSPESTDLLYLEFTDGLFTYELSYELTNLSGDVIYSGSNFSSGEVVQDTFELSLDKCYDFQIYDAGNNGFSGGSLTLVDSENNEIVYIEGDFGSSASYPFYATDLTQVSKKDVSDDIKVFPNPSAGIINIYLNNKLGDEFVAKIYDLAGKQIEHTKMIEQTKKYYQINLSNIEQGIYFLTLTNGKQIFNKKIQIIH